MVAAELNSNPPLSPFFKGGIFSAAGFPSLAKRGRVDFWAEWRRELFDELWF
jgi:hypothetical protein